jgi:sec-independent protein translocase protein TatA
VLLESIQGPVDRVHWGPYRGGLMEIFSPLHILLIVGIALLLFGPSKFAALGKGVGEGIRNFKSAMKEGDSDPQKKA